MGSDMILLIPLLALFFAGLCQGMRSAKKILALLGIGVFIICIPVFFTIRAVFLEGFLFAWGQRLYVDVFSAYHLAILSVIFLIASIYTNYYFQEEIASGLFNIKTARRFGSLWFVSFAAMTLVFISNDLGIMWVGMETTTLVTAFLICPYRKKKALEAMWKYLIICSVGIALAFMGTIIFAAAAYKLFTDNKIMFLWTSLHHFGHLLNPGLIKMGFLFIIVGYGTKVGLAPMHTWLPDAHSQAPTPVSAIFSGFMLNTALYCILRYVSLVNSAIGSAHFTNGLLIFFGITSILIAAAFIPFQKDVKRMLAYHSVEHMGIITLGFGLGPIGIFAALFHTFNHSICKTISFFCAGRIGQLYKTHNMDSISGAIHTSPFLGMGLFGGILALVGVVPFSIFVSEVLILRAAVNVGAYTALVLFLIGSSVVFAGAMHHGISMVWGDVPKLKNASFNVGAIEAGIIIVFLAVLLILGLWMPERLSSILKQASDIIGL